MCAFHRGPNIVTDGLVFGYDADERSSRFYKGEPTTNLYSGPSSPALYFTNAYNGNYGFGSNTNIQTNIDNSDQIIANLNVQKISRINSDVSQFDYIEWTGIISRGFTTTFQPNEVRTISFYYKGTFGTILNPYIGNSGTLLLYSDNAISGNNTTDIRIPVTTNEWQRVSFRVYNSSSISTSVFGYGWMVLHQNQFTSILSNTEYWKFTGIQVELKSHPTQFTTGTRLSTQSLIDLKRTNTIDLSNVSFDWKGSPYFYTGGNEILLSTSLINNLNTSNLTVEAWVKHDSWGAADTGRSYIANWHIFDPTTPNQRGFILRTYSNSQYPSFWWCWGSSYDAITSSIPLTLGKYHHVLATYEKGVAVKIYVDGVLGSTSGNASNFLVYDTTNPTKIGHSGINNSRMGGEVKAVKLYNKALSSSEVLQNYNASKGRFEEENRLNEGLVLHLDVNNKNSYPGTGTTWYDLAGTNNGTLTNGPAFSTVGDGSIAFDGTNDIVLGSSVAFGTSGYTITGWVNVTSTTGYGRWFSGAIGTSFHNPDLAFLSTNLNILFIDATLNTGWVNTGVAITANTWTHLAYTFNSSGKVDVYKNGALIYSNIYTASTLSSTKNYAIGNRYDVNGEAILGKAGNTKIWNRVLIANEVSSLYNSEKSRYGL